MVILRQQALVRALAPSRRFWRRLLTVVVLCFQVVAASQWAHAKKDSEETPAKGSPAVFTRLLRDDVVRFLYQEMQMSHLAYSVDARVHNYYINDQLLAPIYYALIDKEPEQAKIFHLSAILNYQRIVPEMQGQKGVEARLLRLLKDVGLRLGFSQGAIANARLYVMQGESPNAFTVSGSRTSIVVGVNSQLLAVMDENQLRGVLAHELSHIALHHPVRERLNRMMLGLLAHWLQKGSQVMPGAISRPTEASADQSFLVGLSDEIIARLQGDPNFFNHFIRIGLRPFLALVVEVLSSEQANPRTVQFFKTAYNAFDAFDGMTLDSQVLNGYMNDALGAFSRAAEKSADQLAASAISNLGLMESLAILSSGRKWDPASDKNRLVGHLLSGLEVRQQMPNMVIPADQTHPFLNPRMLTLAELPKYPFIAIANPFTRLLFFSGYLSGLPENHPHSYVATRTSDQLVLEAVRLLEEFPWSSLSHPRFINLLELLVAEKRTNSEMFAKRYGKLLKAVLHSLDNFLVNTRSHGDGSNNGIATSRRADVLAMISAATNPMDSFETIAQGLLAHRRESGKGEDRRIPLENPAQTPSCADLLKQAKSYL